MQPLTHCEPQVYSDPRNRIEWSFSIVKQAQLMRGETALKVHQAIEEYFKEYAIEAPIWLVLPSRIVALTSPTPTKSLIDQFNDLKALILPIIREVDPKAEFYNDFFDHILRRSELTQDAVSEILEKLYMN